MEPERWRRIQELFHAALERKEGQRAAFLDEVCAGNEALRREVESLLACERSAEDFMEAPALEVADQQASGEHSSCHSSDDAGLTGKTISHYRVLERLGRGGMGVVYKAKDTKLGRLVALKVLPPAARGEGTATSGRRESVTLDPQALERFKREARAASALNHPHICTIYDIDEYEGQPFIAMELLEGQTLKERIGVGAGLVPAPGRPERPPLQIGTLLELAVQIVDALDAAHSRGIVHRDIKAANIFVTTRGDAKILDFGLAKLVQPVRGASEGSALMGEAVSPYDAETALATEEQLTAPGVAIGTAAYMSPEQARGEHLDARTDLFSFGLVLYEMATGGLPFQGKTSPEIFAALLREHPRSVLDSNPELPAELDRIIGKALEKDREMRYQSAAEVRTDLKRLKRDTASGRVPEEEKLGAPPLATRWGLRTMAMLAMLVVGLAVGWLVWRRSRPLPQITQRRLTSNSSEVPVLSGAISPDGKYLAYSDSAGLHLKLLESGEVRTLPKPSWFASDGVWSVASWFPDGTQLLTNLVQPGGHSSIWAVSVMGENPRQLRDDAKAWAVSPDGLRIAFTVGAPDYGHEIWTMSGGGGNLQKVLAAGGHESFVDVQWSPHGGRIAYGRGRATHDEVEVTIRTIDLDGGKPTLLVPQPLLVPHPFFWYRIDRGLFSWLPGGHLVYSQFDTPPPVWGIGDGNLWELPVDARSGESSGKPVQVTRWGGLSVRVLGSTADGKRLAVLRRSSQAQAYVGQLEAGGTRMLPPRRLTFSNVNDPPFAWTPDSKQVIINSDRNGRWELFKQPLDQETAKPLVTGSQDFCTARVSADGSWVLYLVLPRSFGRPSTPIPLMRVPVSGGPSQLVLEAHNLVDWRCARPPATLCVLEEASPDNKLHTVTAFDPVKGRGRVLATIAVDPRTASGTAISPDGTRLAFVKQGEPEGHIQLLALDGRPVRDITFKGWPGCTSLSWAPDGKGMYCGTMTAQGATLLHVDLDGKAQLLWQQRGAVGSFGIWGEPSPDGRYLAIMTEMMDSNIWMVENF